MEDLTQTDGLPVTSLQVRPRRHTYEEKQFPHVKPFRVFIFNGRRPADSPLNVTLVEAIDFFSFMVDKKCFCNVTYFSTSLVRKEVKAFVFLLHQHIS